MEQSQSTTGSNNHIHEPPRPLRGRGAKTTASPRMPGRRHVKTPPPKETPTRLREHITMRPNADTSILGSRAIKASPPEGEASGPQAKDTMQTQLLSTAQVQRLPPAIRVHSASPFTENPPPGHRSLTPLVGASLYRRSQSPVQRLPPAIRVHSTSPFTENSPPARRSLTPLDGASLYRRSQSPYVLPTAVVGYDPPPAISYVPSGHSVRGSHYPPAQIFYSHPPSESHPITTENSIDRQLPDPEAQMYQQIMQDIAYRPLDAETSSTGSWVVQGYPDPFAQPPTTRTPFHTPEGSAPPLASNSTIPFLSTPPKTLSSVPVDYLTIDPSVEVSISVASDEVDELDESRIILSQDLENLQTNAPIVQLPPAAVNSAPPHGLPPAQSDVLEPPHKASSTNVGGRPTNKSISFTEKFFTTLDHDLAELSTLLDLDEEKILDKYRLKWRKTSTTSKERYWNLYQQYYQHHQAEEHARLPDLPLGTKGAAAKCFERFKEALGDTGYRTVLSSFAELDHIENPKSDGELKKAVTKYVKGVHDSVSDAS